MSVMAWMRSEPSLKIASLVLAVFVWMYLRTETKPVQILTIPLEYEALPDDLALSGEVPDSVAVRVRAPEPVLRTLAPSRFNARVRLAGARVGDLMVPMSPDMIRSPIGVEVLRVEPEMIRLTIERRIRREVPVVARFTGDPAPGFEHNGYTLTPDRVLIEGPEGVALNVREAVTDEVDIDGRRESFESVVGVVPDRGGVRIVSEGAVSMRVNIREERVTRTFEAVRVTPSLPTGSRVRVECDPETVDVVLEGTRAALDGIDADRIRVMLDLEGMSPREAAYDVRPRVVVAPGDPGSRVAVHSVSVPTVNVKLSHPGRP